jgi:hypothetical protein
MGEHVSPGWQGDPRAPPGSTATAYACCRTSRPPMSPNIVDQNRSTMDIAAPVSLPDSLNTTSMEPRSSLVPSSGATMVRGGAMTHKVARRAAMRWRGGASSRPRNASPL